MKKIISLFKRDYEGTRQVYNEVVEGAEWVVAGEGFATEKLDGTCCLVRDGKLYKRYDRKITKAAKRRGPPFTESDCKPAPEGWEAAELKPNENTGHWPGWLAVGNGPEDKWHREALESKPSIPCDATYELIGPKVQGNPYNFNAHHLERHGIVVFHPQPPRDFDGLRQWLNGNHVEGIVWHHPDGRMVKIKRKDFGFDWPVSEVKQ